MIDRRRRDQFAEHLRHFVAGVMTNWEFEDRLEGDILPTRAAEKSSEPFLRIMYGMAWTLYDDTRRYKLRDKDAIAKEGRRDLARWIVFLYSDREYELPLVDAFNPSGYGCLASLLTLGLAGRQAWDRFLSQVDPALWPYCRHCDFEEDRRHPRLLAGARATGC